MLHKKTVWFVFIVNLAYALYAFLYEYIHHGWSDWGRVSGFWYYCGMGSSSKWSTFAVILSFLVALPAMSFQDDISARTYAAVWMRAGRRDYFRAKLAAVFCIEFLVTFLPFFLNFILCLLCFDHAYAYTPSPFGPQANLDNMISGVNDKVWSYGTMVPLGWLFKVCPVLYVFLFMVFMCVFVGILGVFLTALSFWFRRFKILLFLPVIGASRLGSLLDNLSYGRVLRYGFPQCKYVNFCFWDYVSPISYHGKVYFGFLVFLLLLIAFSYLSYQMICRKEYTDV